MGTTRAVRTTTKQVFKYEGPEAAEYLRTLLELNLILAIVWVGFVVVPQALMNDDSHDVMRDFEVTISADPITC